jgi:prepilin peptidase CpaA
VGGVIWREWVLVGVVALAAVIDFRTRRIPNWLTFSSLFLGLALQFAGSGMHGLVAGLVGVVVGAGLFFIPFALGGMGPGDVKLMGAAGAFLGAEGALWAALFTGVSGGVLALAWALSHGQVSRVLARTGALVGAAIDPRRRAAQGGLPTLERDGNWSIPYGVAIAFGVALSLWWRSGS